MIIKHEAYLSEKEKEVLTVLRYLSCNGILCRECPFRDRNSRACLLSDIQEKIEKILTQYEKG